MPLGARPRVPTDGSSVYSAQAEVNANVNQYLRDYQREGVSWLWGQYARNVGGVLGDEMGLGKTVQVAAFLSAVLGKTGTTDDKARSFPLPEGDCRRALVVVPMTTLGNWERELRTWGCFKVKKFHGADKAAAMRAAEQRECEVLLTTYDMVNRHNDDFCRIDWEVTIWDEVHVIKSPKAAKRIAAARVPCPRRFGLTGTPMSNEYKELWSLFNFVSNDRVGSESDFKTFYAKAMLNGQKKSAKQWEVSKRMRTQKALKQMMDMWMIQRFKSIIADQMPTKRDNIVFCRLAAEQEEVYMRVLDSPDYKQLLAMYDDCKCGSGLKTNKCCNLDLNGVLARWKHPDGDACSRCPSCHMMEALVQLQKISNHLELVKPDEKKMGDAAFSKQADFARMAFGDTSMDVTRDRGFFAQSHTLSCGKMQALKLLLRKWKLDGSKVLIFSYTTQLLDILEDFVSRAGYSHCRLDGTTSAKRREQLVHSFNTGGNSTFLFLLSTKAGGLGINLVSANRVVVFDPNWNPSWDMQAQDRAYRIGQRRDVEVYRLVSSNTIEEKIYQRQLYKQGHEGLALHQRDETRYFEGVAGDKHQQGELFGIRNLLTFKRDESGALQASGTSQLLKGGRRGFDADSDDEDAPQEEDAADGTFRIRKAQRAPGGEEGGEGGEEEEADDDGGALDGEDGVERGVEWLLRKLDPSAAGGKSRNRAKGAEGANGGEAEANESERAGTISAELAKTGAVHTHLSSKVLGGAPLAAFERKSGGKAAAEAAAWAKDAAATSADAAAAAVKPEAQADGGASSSGAHPQPPPDDYDPVAAAFGPKKQAGKRAAITAGGEPSAAATGKAEARSIPATEKENALPSRPSKAARGDSNQMPEPRDVHDCLCDCSTFAEYMRRLQTDREVAWRAEYCRLQWGMQEELTAAVNALPAEEEAMQS